MANGFYGPKEAWDALEGLLAPLDATLTAYATRYGMTLRRSDRNWPSRSLHWRSALDCVLEVYLDDERAKTFTLWICAFEDRSDGRYWKKSTLRVREPIAAIADHLAELLDAGRIQAEAWKPADLEFVAEPRPWLQ